MQKPHTPSSFTVVADFDGDPQELVRTPVPEKVPILPLRNLTIFPMVMSPIHVGRKSSLRLVKQAQKTNAIIGVFSQLRGDDENPLAEGLLPYGVAARIVKQIEMPDGEKTVIVQAFGRIRMTDLDASGSYLQGTVELVEEKFPTMDTEYMMIVENVTKRAIHLIETETTMPDEARLPVENISYGPLLVNFLSTAIPFTDNVKHDLLRTDDLRERAMKLARYIDTMQQLTDMKNRIVEQTQGDLNQQQREYFLQQQLRNIQDELGCNTSDSFTLRQQADEKRMPQKAREVFEKELEKLERLNPQSPDYNIQFNYLQTMIQMPWGICSHDNLSVTHAQRILNRDHYGMEEVKERILEHLAVHKLRGDMKSPILCLYGPPGVGKTSLGRSIADALGRKYVRASLGGLHDESEIRGHRRTYIGAMPGCIIKNLIKAGTNNPVFVLDEIDKISGQTINGDPSSALLEVLDPEQNSTFHDNFLDMDYDLSQVMFIATANDISQMPRPLLDRMELIEVSGYCTEEKVEIARKHLMPKARKNNGLEERQDITLRKAGLEYLIEHYTRESGVRGLEKQLNKLFRKTALSLEMTGIPPALVYDKETIAKVLGKEPYNREIYQGNDFAGVVTGLAWTSVGGEILFIETSLSRSKAGKLTVTGNLGDVMKESAMIALEYLRAHADMLNVDEQVFDSWNIHIHVPEGATPKDGPSAGITMATSLASALTQRKVRRNLAMTGEITLRGKVLPVGGIKEKILAAKRAGITEIIICQDNRKDIEEIPALYLKGVNFHYVNTVKDVLSYALLDERVADAIDITVPKAEDK
ncbi:MAG: endopeptidase La [Bacteroidaceae bacterium]|nr:endopeptidase La [Bacteroidaceae bacterium]